MLLYQSVQKLVFLLCRFFRRNAALEIISNVIFSSVIFFSLIKCYLELSFPFLTYLCWQLHYLSAFPHRQLGSVETLPSPPLSGEVFKKRVFCPAQCFQISAFTVLHQHNIGSLKTVHKIMIPVPKYSLSRGCGQASPAHEEGWFLPQPCHSATAL